MHEYTEFFKEHKGYDRFFQAIYQKYQSFGNFTGTIKLTNLDKDEAYEFSRTFGKIYHEHETLQITIKRFLKLMAQTKYDNFDLATLIKEYFNLNLETNKEINFQKNNQEQLVYQDLINTYKGKGAVWLQNSIINKNNSYALIHKRYLKNPQVIKEELINILNLINNLPSQKTLLPIYAAMYTKNPHYLDFDGKHITLFLNALSDLEKISYPITREEKINLLYQNNILIDNFSNFVITYNLVTDKDYLNAFAQNKEALILNIQNIINVKKFNGKNKKVFILENPSILSEIIALNINASIIIARGFTNTAVYLLLDKLVANGNTLYYNGDFDPEGLFIASKLKEKYHKNLILFCYDKKDYLNCEAQNSISDKRMALLNKVQNIELQEIKKLLQEYRKAGYQENNTNRIIAYIYK